MSSNYQPADTLYSKTFIGLLIAQFLAAFNDQAIHASAMFFAINQYALNEAQAISLMPILFYAPWAIFCSLAGYLADRYSKRNSLIFWKIAEVAITLIALAGFWLGTHQKSWPLDSAFHRIFDGNAQRIFCACQIWCHARDSQISFAFQGQWAA